MGLFRKAQVDRLVAAAQEHDAACARKGWKADTETDRLMNVYQRARANSSAAELSAFQQRYGDAEYAARTKQQN